MSRILIEDNAFYTLAIKENSGEIEDVFAIASESVVGNIYWAKVENVRGENCFIKYDEKRPNGILLTKEKYKSGDLVLCRGVREAFDNKGAIFKQEIILGAKYIIFSNSFIGMKYSKKLSKEEKKSLSAIENKSDYGFIIRHTAVQANKDRIEEEMFELIEVYEKIYKEANGNKVKCLFQKSNVEKALEEIDPTDCQIITENKELEKYPNIIIHNQGESLFDYYGIREEFNSLFSRKMKLPDGVELVFDYTEAMTVIDINSSSSFGKSYAEINKAALKEAINQIKLRNIGGIIFVDIISQKKSEKVADFANKLLENDREKARATLIKDFDIVAINRQKRYNSLKAIFYNKCDIEQGFVKSTHTICGEMAADIRKLCFQSEIKNVVLRVNEEIFGKLQQNRSLRNLLLTPFETKIFIKKDNKIKHYNIEITDDKDLLGDALNIQEDK